MTDTGAETATVSEVLRGAAQAHPARDAYVHGPERITYARLDAAVDRFAGLLLAEGVARGDVVMLELPSSIDFAVAYLGALRIGAITSAVNLRLGATERASIRERTEPRVVVGPGSLDHRCSIDPVDDPVDHTGRRRLAAREDDVRAEDPACIVWTSGTTGAPKGAVYDHARLAAISRNMGVLTELGDRRLSVLPFPHVGYMTRVWDEIVHGTTLVLAGEPWSAAETLRLVREERVTVMTGVPTQWILLLDHPDLARTDFSRVRLAGIGGASVAPGLVRRMRHVLGCPVVQRYTSTEAGITTGTDPGDGDDVVARTVGRPAPEVELRLVRPDGGTVPHGEVGEVTVRSPAMMREYWRDHEQTAAAIDPDGFLHTGDLGVVGGDGNLRLVGRTKEMYVRGGYNVYPAEVEAALAEHPEIAEVAVVGAPDPVLGEIGVAFAVPTPEAATTLTREGLTAWLGDRLADYKRPDRLVLVQELPTTSMMKIDKHALAARARKER